MGIYLIIIIFIISKRLNSVNGHRGTGKRDQKTDNLKMLTE